MKIRSVRAEIGKANKKERKRETGERRNVERINIVATELCENGERRQWLPLSPAGLKIGPFIVATAHTPLLPRWRTLPWDSARGW